MEGMEGSERKGERDRGRGRERESVKVNQMKSAIQEHYPLQIAVNIKLYKNNPSPPPWGMG